MRFWVSAYAHDDRPGMIAPTVGWPDYSIRLAWATAGDVVWHTSVVWHISVV